MRRPPSRSCAGERPTHALFEAAGRLAAGDARPISDTRGSADYRRSLVAVLTARALADCCAALDVETCSVMKTLLTCTVNGEEHTVLADSRDTLLELLRERLGLTGTKEGCGNGNCGTCTVLMDGAPVNACLVLALEAPGRDIVTIEGAVRGRRAASDPAGAGRARRHAMRLLHAGHRARRQGAARRQPEPDDAQDIRHAIAGNLCRCTGYDKIVEAIAALPQRHKAR